MLLLIGLHYRFVMSGDEWGMVAGLSFVIAFFFLLPHYEASSLTQSLRQTFEENMGIQSIDTHSM